MKNKIVALSAVAAAFAFIGSANAATVTAGAVGQLFNSVGDSSATFDSVPGAPQTYNGPSTAFGPFTDNGASFSGQGMLMQNGPAGDQPSLGLYAQPLHDTSVYLTVMPATVPNTGEVIALGGSFNHFGLYWG